MQSLTKNTFSRLSSPYWMLAAVLSILSCVEAIGQPRQTHRFEFKQKNSDEYYSIISMKDEGLALLREKNKYNGSKKLWEVLLLDTALQQRSTFDLEIENRYPLIGYEYAKGQLYLL